MITEPNLIVFELVLVVPVLELPNRIVFWTSVIIKNSIITDLLVYLTETFWESFSVISVEESPNRNDFGINLVFVCNGTEHNPNKPTDPFIIIIACREVHSAFWSRSIHFCHVLTLVCQSYKNVFLDLVLEFPSLYASSFCKGHP